jgi:hypothetical protein
MAQVDDDDAAPERQIARDTTPGTGGGASGGCQMIGRSTGGRGPGTGFQAAILAVLVVAIASCGSSTPAPSAAGASEPPAATGPGGATAPASSPAGPGQSDIDRLVADAVAGASPMGLSTADRALQDLMDEQSGLTAALGPELHNWLQEQRSAAAVAALEDRGIDPGALGPTGISTGLIASIDIGLTAATGLGWIGTAVVASALVQGAGSSVGQSGSSGPQTSQTTAQTTVGNQHITTTMTTTTQLAISGSTVVADADATETTTVADAATGAAIGSSTSHNHIHVEANMCPDASGGVPVTVTSDWSEDAGGMPGGGSFSMQSTMTIAAVVADDAFLVSSTTNASTTYTGNGPAGSQSGSMSTSWSQSMGPGGSVSGGTSGPVTASVTGNLPVNQAAAAHGLSTILPMQIANQALEVAQGAWRGGKCVEITISERDRDVKRNEVIPLTAQARQKIEGVNLTAPVVATLSGVRSVDPVDTPVPGPAQFTYTAGPAKDDVGTVHLKSTSRRGIGMNAVRFRVKIEGWFVEGTYTRGPVSGTSHGKHCGDDPLGDWTVDGTYTFVSGVTIKGKQTWKVTITDGDPSTGIWTGPFTYRDDSKLPVAGRLIQQHTRVKGDAKVTLNEADGTALMQFTETSREQTAEVPGGFGSGPSDPQPMTDLTWSPDAGC